MGVPNEEHDLRDMPEIEEDLRLIFVGEDGDAEVDGDDGGPCDAEVDEDDVYCNSFSIKNQLSVPVFRVYPF